jgi:hypothetical protein
LGRLPTTPHTGKNAHSYVQLGLAPPSAHARANLRKFPVTPPDRKKTEDGQKSDEPWTAHVNSACVSRIFDAR